MRTIALLAALATLTVSTCASTAVHARGFRQTYGATVATPEGCAWNLNSDYFVPRTCDTGHYDLFSPCKTDHYRSPACKNLHPVHCGYCTPYGECHYKWRDEVYKKYCGCTPLACTHGPWKLEKCCKHCRRMCESGGCCHAGGCGGFDSDCVANGGCQGVGAHVCERTYVAYADNLELPNVEPIGGESLGTIQAFPMGLMGARGMGGGMQGGMPGMGMGMGAGMQGAPMQGGAFMQAPAPVMEPALSVKMGEGNPSLTLPVIGNNN